MSQAGENWTPRTGPGSRNWYSVASSSDGTKLVGVVRNGFIYTSNDSGVTWTQQNGAGTRTWYSVASSADGTKLVAVVFGGYIYTSNDSGVTWIQQNSSGSRNWSSVASSANGNKLVGAVSYGYIYTSTATETDTTTPTCCTKSQQTRAISAGDWVRLRRLQGARHYLTTVSNGTDINVPTIPQTPYNPALLIPRITGSSRIRRTTGDYISFIGSRAEEFK